MLRTLPIALLFTACATSPRQADTASPEPDRAGLQTVVDDLDAAWNAHDPDQHMALIADDAVTVTPMGTRVEGRAAHEKMYASPGPTKQTQSKTTIQGTQWIADDVVLLDLQQTLTGPGVEQIGTDTADVVVVVRWDGTSWKVVAARPFVPAAR